MPVRILVVSNLGPVAGNPLGGVFLPPRLDGLVAAGNEVTLTMPIPDSLSIRASTRIRGARGNAGGTIGPEPAIGDTEWGLVPLPLPEWRRWAGLLGRPEHMARTLADSVLASVGHSHFDLIQGHGMYEFMAGAVAREIARSLGVPFTVTLHGSDVNQLHRWRRPAFRRVAVDAAALLFVSEGLRRKARVLGLVPGPSAVTPNGVDGTVFHTNGRRESQALNAVFVGSLATVKGADRLPAIVRTLQSHEPSARVHVVGDGPLRRRLEKRLAGTRTTFLGRVAPLVVADVLRHADVALIPSRDEGWSCVALEAQACGARVVATDVGGLPESVGPGGELVSQAPFDADQFALAVLRQWRRTDVPDVAARARRFDWRVLGVRESELLRQLAE